MPNERNRFDSFRLDIDKLTENFNDEREHLQKLRQSTQSDEILRLLLDLLEVEDYQNLISTIPSRTFDLHWLIDFSQRCMKRYIDADEIFFISNKTNSLKENSFLNKFIERIQRSFSIEYFHLIVDELEELNRFKINQICQQMRENNRLIDEIRRLCTSNDESIETTTTAKDDGIIHLSSTPAQIIPRPIYINYKPIHMVYLRDDLWVKNDQETRFPFKGICNTFVADLINTKSINILEETTGKTFDIPTKWLYFSKSSDPHVILPLKLRVLIIDSTTGQRRYGLIGEEPGKNNDYRCLVFFTDDPKNISASYHHSSQLHICLDQTFSTHMHECQSDFLERYFASYPERMMLRAKEGITVKVRNTLSTSNSFVPALVIQIDGSMMQIEFSHNKQRVWLYRGSPLLDQMHNYYSTQNQAKINGFPRHTARQHLSARRTNAPEIICLNDQANRTIQSTPSTPTPTTPTTPTIPTTTTKSVRTVDQIQESSDEAPPSKRPRISSEQDLSKVSRTLRTRTNQTLQRQTSSNVLIPTRSSQAAHHSRIIVNPLFLELAEKFLLHYSYEFHPHDCSHKCVVYAEKSFHQLPKTMNPFLKPFACHWTMLDNVYVRKAGEIRIKAQSSTFIYCAPCGRKLITIAQIDHYLQQTKSKLSIELFVLDHRVNMRQHYSPDGKILNRDISNGQENIPISVVNEVDKEPNKIEEPSSFTYRVERTPVEGVNMVINEPTMTCCSCTDGCRVRTQCACWLRTLKYAELIGDDRVKAMKRKGRTDSEILNQLGYQYRRLMKNVPGGIFECNSRCSCHRHICSNRVVQNGIIAQLQLFKTVGRGWGVRTLHDLPIGTFISVYSGEIFTSEQADERGKLLGDEYQADLDFFENINNDSEEEHNGANFEDDDDDDQDSSPSSTESLNTRARELLKKKDSKKSSTSDIYTTDEIDHNSILNRTGLPDYDGVVYTLDAKLVGNIGRYFNHSCSPNIAVQNVFVDTHDIHFPWIGFFATKTIRSGSELCWDYNYTVGEIAGRRMDCNCGSAECRRRVL